ncbi:PepSY domain-containing protein [Bacillus tianshenii]|nr:PepSY domain-containing protein [Bacillus tianshenii]
MKFRNFLVGASIGFASALMVAKKLDEQFISPEKALKYAKDAFKEKGPVDGAWVHMEPEQVSKFDMTYNVYRGGISSSLHGELKQFEFLVDAKSGTIIDVYANPS